MCSFARNCQILLYVNCIFELLPSKVWGLYSSNLLVLSIWYIPCFKIFFDFMHITLSFRALLSSNSDLLPSSGLPRYHLGMHPSGITRLKMLTQDVHWHAAQLAQTFPGTWSSDLFRFPHFLFSAKSDLRFEQRL